jgi:dihydrofolate reductase
MGKVSIGFSMSLDGFIAGPNDSPELGLGEGGDRLFAWYFSGETDYEVPNGDGVMKMSREGAEVVKEAGKTSGALVTGRRTFDIARAWGGRHPMDVPVIVVTHRVPQEWVRHGSIFTFVTDGVESAIEKARRIAGDKNVAVGGPSIAQQCLKAGLIDEIQIDLVSILLGGGLRLFDHLGPLPIELESTRVTANPGVTHLTYRVVKSD